MFVKSRSCKKTRPNVAATLIFIACLGVEIIHSNADFFYIPGLYPTAQIKTGPSETNLVETQTTVVSQI